MCARTSFIQLFIKWPHCSCLENRFQTLRHDCLHFCDVRETLPHGNILLSLAHIINISPQSEVWTNKTNNPWFAVPADLHNVMTFTKAELQCKHASEHEAAWKSEL